MIRRFQKICGVGCYANCNAGSIQFEKMTLIYGENCYGKSTLCDIIRSLADDEPNYITDRMAIPAVNGGRQIVKLTLDMPGESQEKSIVFDEGVWKQSLPEDMHLEIFDTDFMHRNIFTGLTIQRDNRENITRFVLGDSSVQMAELISNNKSELRKTNSDIGDLKVERFDGITDLNDFLSMQVEEDLVTLENKFVVQSSILEREIELAKNLELAQNKPEPTLCQAPNPLDTTIEKVEEALAATYEKAHADAESMLQKHLDNHTKIPQQARYWVQKGTTIMKGEDCPFCGQKIVGDSAELIAAYKAVFDEAYDNYVDRTLSMLNEAHSIFANTSLADLRLQIERNLNACSQYPDLRKQPDLLKCFEQIEAMSAELIKKCEEWAITNKSLNESLAAAIQNKKENVHKAVQPWNGGAAVDNLKDITQKVVAYNKSLQPIIAAIKQFKNGLEEEEVARRIKGAREEIEMLKLKIRRVEMDSVCSQYRRLLERKRELDEDIKNMQVSFEAEQTEYLKKYFSAINEIFNSLGNNHFTIKAESSRRGDMPTFQLSVLFKGKPITPDKLKSYFSESDRRALAFAVFWARLETLETGRFARTIVVLDDPITSFDDGRIERTIRRITPFLSRLRQIIILTHYKNYLKPFIYILHGRQDDCALTLASLYQDENGTQLRRANVQDYIENEQQRAFRRIHAFIEREDRNDVQKDLRVFLETAVKDRYYMPIYKYDFHKLSFSALLDELVRVGAMNTETREAIELFRPTLNREHHAWTNSSHEEKIGIAADLLKLVYNKL